MNYKLSGKTKAINVNHERWVHCNELKLGMYVVELDKPWEQTDFLFQGFFLDKHELIEDVRRESQYVLVQEQKNTLVSRQSPSRLCGGHSKASFWSKSAR